MPTARELSQLIDRDLNYRLGMLEFVDWHEDHLSLVLVDSLRNVLRTVDGIATPNTALRHEEKRTEPQFFLKVEAYKATGALERTHGDIAIVVQDMDLNRTGTGFYEAKAEGPRGGYPAYNMRQLRRLSSATPQLALLLYERTEKVVCNDEYGFSKQIDGPATVSGKLRVIGANIAKKYSRPEFIPDLPQSFGHHFVSGYLTGRDLDYSRTTQLTIQKWLRVTRRAFPIVLSIRISRSPLVLDEPARIALSEVEPVPALHPAFVLSAPERA